MKLLTVQQAAALLDVHPLTLSAWRERGYGPPVTKLGRNVRYREELLDAWIEAQTHTPERIEEQGGELALPLRTARTRVHGKHRLGGYRTKRERCSEDSGRRTAAHPDRPIPEAGTLPI